VRTSGIIFEGLDTVDDKQESAGVSSTDSQPTPTGIVHCPFEPHSPTFVGGSSNLLSPSTDEEDLFGVPQDLPSEYGSSKDDDQSLFSCAPVLSPLEPLPKIPTEHNLPKRTAVESPERETLHASKLLEDSLDENPTVPASYISSNEDSISVSDFSSSNHDICGIQPSQKVLHDNEEEKKKKEPFSGTEKQELSGTDNLFPSVQPIPEMNASYTTVGKPGLMSDSPKNADSSLKDYMSSKDPFFLDDGILSRPENMQQPESHEELFRPGSVKHADHVSSSSRRGSAEILDDLFSTARIDKSIPSDDVNDAVDDDDLFSSDARTSSSKDIKKGTSVNKSVIIEAKEVYDVQDDISFLSGEEKKQSLPTKKDLSSKNIKVVNTQNSNNSMFGGDSLEYDDLFVATSARKVDNSVIKGNVTSSTKSSLFEEDDGDDLFGSSKSASKSALSAKPANSEGQY
jgi:hypothetical protein